MLPFCCNVKNIYIVTLAAVIIFFFLKIISLIHSVNSSFMGKEKGVYFPYLFFDCNALYMYMFPFFQQCKKTARSAISNFTQIYVIWSSHFQGFV